MRRPALEHGLGQFLKNKGRPQCPRIGSTTSAGNVLLPAFGDEHAQRRCDRHPTTGSIQICRASRQAGEYSSRAVKTPPGPATAAPARQGRASNSCEVGWIECNPPGSSAPDAASPARPTARGATTNTRSRRSRGLSTGNEWRSIGRQRQHIGGAPRRGARSRPPSAPAPIRVFQVCVAGDGPARTRQPARAG